MSTVWSALWVEPLESSPISGLHIGRMKPEYILIFFLQITLKYLQNVNETNCSFILFLCIDICVVFENVKHIILNLAFKLNEYTNASLWLYIGDSNSLSMLL
jgi:hypothetical protein